MVNARAILSSIFMFSLLSCSGEEKSSATFEHDKIVLIKDEYTSKSVTVANTTEIFIDLKSGGQKELFLRADNIGDLRLIWLSRDRLLVTYVDGKITKFQNSWETDDPNIAPIMIDLVRVKGAV